MSIFQICYTLLGGLGLFFYGMKTMSDSLQAIAGDVIRKVINSLTSNRIFAVLVGIVVTTIIQSSSVTSVMVVGFVNAGLMELGQAIGVILGANIGTTITGWIISIKIGKYGLLFIGLGILPALFSRSEKFRSIGKVFFGIGMIFFGLQIMSGAFKPLRTHQGFLDLISYFNGESYPHYVASILTGCFLTVVIQSSSAMLGITMALATSGIVGFPTAAALVMGENVGTTITAFLASIGANVSAKRAAYAHSLFNIFGVAFIFSIFPYYVDFIEWLLPGEANLVLADGSRPNISSHIAASHTFFNVCNTLLFIPLIGVLKKVVVILAPDKNEKEKEKFVLLGSVSEVLPATAIAQTLSELKKMNDILGKMYRIGLEYLSSEKKDEKLYKKIVEYENECDDIQKDITLFLCHVMEREMSMTQSKQIQVLIRMADEMESIADYLMKVASYKHRIVSENWPKELMDEFEQFMAKIWEFYEYCIQSLYLEEALSKKDVQGRSEGLKLAANSIRDLHLERVGKKVFTPLSALTYSDMIVGLRKIRAHSQNIAEGLNSIYDSENL